MPTHPADTRDRIQTIMEAVDPGLERIRALFEEMGYDTLVRDEEHVEVTLDGESQAHAVAYSHMDIVDHYVIYYGKYENDHHASSARFNDAEAACDFVMDRF